MLTNRPQNDFGTWLERKLRIARAAGSTMIGGRRHNLQIAAALWAEWKREVDQVSALSEDHLTTTRAPVLTAAVPNPAQEDESQ